METESELMRNAPIVDKMQQGQKAPAARWRNIDDVTEFASKDIVACRRIAGKNETPRRADRRSGPRELRPPGVAQQSAILRACRQRGLLRYSALPDGRSVRSQRKRQPAPWRRTPGKESKQNVIWCSWLSKGCLCGNSCIFVLYFPDESLQSGSRTPVVNT